MASPSSSKATLSPPPYLDATTFARSLFKPLNNLNDDDDDGLGGLGCQPSEEFWLDDGSVILICGTIGFRVHRSVLSMHSEIFRGMLARTDHATAQTKQAAHETFDGCLVFRLQDAHSDMRYFLRAIYDRKCV
jgi:hypothetical protein